MTTRYVVDVYPEEFLLAGWIARATPEGTEALLQIQGRTFAWALARLSEFICGEPGEVEVAIVKRMGQGLEAREHMLDPTTVQWLRTDPTAAIKGLSPETRHVVVRQPLPPQADFSVRLQSGVETLARALGDIVWLRLRGDRLESPFTGRWVPYTGTQLEQVVGESGQVVRLDLRTPLPYRVTEDWLPVATASLLATSMPRFYLPVLYSGWVERDTLEAQYKQYLENKYATEQSAGTS